MTFVTSGACVLAIFLLAHAGAASGQPVQEWVARYHGPSSSPEEAATAVATDNSGNAYVAGTSWDTEGGAAYVTIKYTPSGAEQWVARYHYFIDVPAAIAVDGPGNIYVTGGTRVSIGGYYQTVKYNPTGGREWVAFYYSPGDTLGYVIDRATALAVDDSGNVYVTGYSAGSSGTTSEYATVKYNSAGVRQWVARYNGPGNGDDGANAIAIDRAGGIYVTGQSMGDGTDYDYATIKYSPAGVELWVNRYDGPGNGRDEATAIGVDPSGNIWVTGRSTAMGGRSDYATIKYTEEGAYLGLARYTGQQHSYDVNFATALAIDSAGSVFVTGYSTGQGTGYDYATVKYGSSLVQEWAARYNGPADGSDQPSDLAVDEAGNPYVTGTSQGVGTGYDIATVKYTGSGSREWAVRYDGPKSKDDRATALTVDRKANVYVTGSCWASDTMGTDFVTIKYSQGGGIAEAPSPRPVPLDLQITGPNPTRGAVTVRYALPAGQAGVLEFLDVTGRVVRSYVLSTSSARSPHSLLLTPHCLPRICFVRLSSGTHSATAKLVRLE